MLHLLSLSSGTITAVNTSHVFLPVCIFGPAHATLVTGELVVALVHVLHVSGEIPFLSEGHVAQVAGKVLLLLSPWLLLGAFEICVVVGVMSPVSIIIEIWRGAGAGGGAAYLHIVHLHQVLLQISIFRPALATLVAGEAVLLLVHVFHVSRQIPFLGERRRTDGALEGLHFLVLVATTIFPGSGRGVLSCNNYLEVILQRLEVA